MHTLYLCSIYRYTRHPRAKNTVLSSMWLPAPRAASVANKTLGNEAEWTYKWCYSCVDYMAISVIQNICCGSAKAPSLTNCLNTTFPEAMGIPQRSQIQQLKLLCFRPELHLTSPRTDCNLFLQCSRLQAFPYSQLISHKKTPTLLFKP